MHQKRIYTSELADFVPQVLTDLIGSKGLEVIERIGVDAVKGVIADVLCGRNLRTSTEMLTRRRLGMMNAATLVMFLAGVRRYKDLPDRLPQMAASGLRETKSKAERWILQWAIGLTSKAVQNVLRDSDDALGRYVTDFSKATRSIVERCRREFGEINAEISLSSDRQPVTVSWEFLVSLFCTVGSQTLAIRGSEKSTYGKLFERLVLGAVLTLLGFRLTRPDDIPRNPKNIFWLSSQFGAREADATLIVKPGFAVRFDLGFIGRGNPEITKDKVSRFERQLEVDRQQYNSTTFVIVDRIGERSTLADQAKKIDAVVIQMSWSQWPKGLAGELNARFGISHPLLKMPADQTEVFIKSAVERMDITPFVSAVSTLIAEEDDDPDD